MRPKNAGVSLICIICFIGFVSAVSSQSSPSLIQQDFSVSANYSYDFNIQVGTPPQMVTVSLDFGLADLIFKDGESSCIEFGCNWQGLYNSVNFNKSSTLRRNSSFTTSPLSSDGVIVSGNWARDRLTIGNYGEYTINDTTFLIQSDSLQYYTSETLYNGYDHIYNAFGLGPRGLQSTVHWLDEHGMPGPTYDSLLYSLKSMTPSFSIWIDPTTYQRGILTLGGIDKSQYIPGSLIWMPIAKPTGVYGNFQEPVYLGIDLIGMSMTFRNNGRQWQNQSFLPLPTVAILNSRQNFSLPLPFLESIGGLLSAEWASSEGMYIVRCDVEGTLSFMLGSFNFNITLENLLIPLSMEDMAGFPLCGLNIGESDQVYLSNEVLKNYFIAVDYQTNQIAFGNLSSAPDEGVPKQATPINSGITEASTSEIYPNSDLVLDITDVVSVFSSVTPAATPKFYSTQSTKLILGTNPLPSILTPKNNSEPTMTAIGESSTGNSVRAGNTILHLLVLGHIIYSIF